MVGGIRKRPTTRETDLREKYPARRAGIRPRCHSQFTAREGACRKRPKRADHDSIAEPITARTSGARSCGIDRTCGGDRRRRPDRADVGGRAGVGGDRRRHRRTTRQSGARRIASRGSSLPHHRGARSAWHRGTIPLGGASRPESGVRRGRLGHQRLPHPPQLRARALAEPLRAHPGRAGSASSGFRSFAAARWWASRRTTPASTSSCPTARRSERSTSSAATEDAA